MLLFYAWKFSLEDSWKRSGCLLSKSFSPSTNLMRLFLRFEELNQDLPLGELDGFKSWKKKKISQNCMWLRQENSSLHDLLIWTMQICYSDLNPPVKNIKSEIKHPENIERGERDVLSEKVTIFL